MVCLAAFAFTDSLKTKSMYNVVFVFGIPFCFNSKEERESLESAEISNHKKLCIQLKRAEKRVLEKALKFVSTTRNKTAETRLETGRHCDNEIDERQATTTSSDVMDDITSAAEPLSVNGE